MAESVLLNLAGNVIGALSLPVFQEISQLWGVGNELEKLKNTVSTIQSVLLDAEEKFDKSHQVKNWIERLKDVLYDAVDILEDISVDARLRDLRSHNKVRERICNFFSSSNQSVFKLKMAHKLKQVTMKISAIKDDKPLYLEERPTEMGVKIGRRKREQTHSFIGQEEIIGRDDDKREIIKLLTESNTKENVSVVSIVGIGGLGKTALAQYVYNDNAIREYFELRIWVCVSNDSTVKMIVANIVANTKIGIPECVEMNQIQSILHKEIDGKKYLLVLDDLWIDNREDWLKLKSSLDGGARGSKILITTRTQVVSKTAGTIRPYSLKGLSSGASLELFIRVASDEEQEIAASEKVSIGKEIVDKCNGIPLAIRVIGGLLYFQKSRADWLHFKDNELQKITQKENDITAILKLSYDNLPSHIKQCFAFCSLFPKDYSIRKSSLISYWISLGFVQPSSNGDLDVEDIAHEYFMHLLWRNFFQDIQEDSFGNVTICKMHDLMHDLACLVAGIESCNIKFADSRTRHISYGSNFELFSHEFQMLEGKNTKVRTMLSTEDLYASSRESSNEFNESTCRKLLSNLRYLRVLTLHNTNMKIVPNSLCKLKHLCHLDVSHNSKLERLPSSIKGLQNLVVLKLNDCDCFKELPGDIGSLGNLGHLDLDGCVSLNHMPRSLSRLTTLRTLTRFIVGDYRFNPKRYARLSDLSGLNNLRGELTISIRGQIENAAIESKIANVKAKCLLEKLYIEWNGVDGKGHNEEEVIENHETLLEGLQPHTNLRGLYIDNYDGARFPQWMMDDVAQCLPNLNEVYISRCQKCQYLPPLVRLPHLKTLFIYELNSVESIHHDPSSSNTSHLQLSFPCLSKLAIIECPKLKSLPLHQDLESLALGNVSEELLKQSFHLQKLKFLEIGRIAYLETLPKAWLQSLSSLQTLFIKECPNLTSLSIGMQRLSSLKFLYIWQCEVLDLSVDENHNVMQQLMGLTSLHGLFIENLPKLISLPDWLFHVTTLEVLRIEKCSNIVSLSNLIGDLTSLQRLEIIECPNLTSLPTSISTLTFLQSIRIIGCPKLEEKCREVSGEDWHKIAHVANVKLGE